jgi:hypothetical protein
MKGVNRGAPAGLKADVQARDVARDLRTGSQQPQSRPIATAIAERACVLAQAFRAKGRQRRIVKPPCFANVAHPNRDVMNHNLVLLF